MSEAQIMVGDNRAWNQRQGIDYATSEGLVAAALTREEIDARIEKVGIIPAVRLASPEDALFVAEALAEAGIPLIEINMAEAGAMNVVSHLAQHAPEMIVGAGSIFSTDAAIRCLDAGAKFLSSDIFVPEVVGLAAKEGISVIAGSFTPTEIMAAWNAGSDFVKVAPCDAVGGYTYIRSLKAALPQVRLVAAGGVNQLTALDFVKAGATSLSVGNELIPGEAIWLRQPRRIQELCRRFLVAVDAGRTETTARLDVL